MNMSPVSPSFDSFTKLKKYQMVTSCVAKLKNTKIRTKVCFKFFQNTEKFDIMFRDVFFRSFANKFCLILNTFICQRKSQIMLRKR